MQLLALTDQGVVSATSFLMSLLIGRFAGAGQLGLYAVGVTVFATVFTIHGALISVPYTIQRHRPLATPGEHAGGALALCWMLSILTAVSLVMLALGLMASGARLEFSTAILAFAAAIPFAVSRDFLRRFVFAHLEIANALRLDFNVAAVQLLIVAWFAYAGMLSAVTAFSAIGISCGIAAIICLHQIRSKFRIRFNQIRATMQRSWSLGKWLVVADIMIQIQGFATYWLTLAIAGAAATGVYAACMTVISVANPVVNGLGNLLLPKLVLEWKQRGAAGLRRKAIQDSLLLGAAMAPLCIVVVLAGDNLLHFLYPGREYAGYGETTVVLAFAALVYAVGMPASFALASMEQPRSLFVVNTVGAFLTVVLVSWFTVEYGILGAACGWLLGNTVVTIWLWLRLLSLLSQSVDTQNPIQVLRDLDQALDPHSVDIVRLGEGGESCVYAVHSKHNAPIYGGFHSVILKIYKPNEPVTLGEVRAQFAALSRLNERLDGMIIDQWTISTPKPLHVCETPLALVMTSVPGSRDLKLGAASDDNLTPKAVDDLARTLALAMRQLWYRGLTHGDLGLQNILYDVPTKSLSLIDPGTDEWCQVCANQYNHRHPAALELGHLIRDLGTDVKDLIGNPMARLRREVFVECAIRTYLGTLRSTMDRRCMVEEIRESAKSHLINTLKQPLFSWGLFKLIVTRLVVRRMDSFMERVVAGFEAEDDLYSPDCSILRTSGS